MILDELGRRVLFFDGAMGTLLQARGLKPGELPETWNLSHPDVVRDIHLQYLRAGADVITTNTFGANALKYGQRVEETVSAAVGIARSAVEQAGHGYVALDMGPTGKLLQPFGDLPFEDAVALYRQQALAGERAGADCIVIETMSDTYELKAAVLGAKETALPVFATLVFDKTGKMLTGADVATACALLEGLGVDAMGFNCGLGPEQMESLYQQLRAVCSLPVIVNPNAGLPREEGGCTHFDVGPEEFAAVMRRICEAGAWAVGGCCGTTPAHIAATAAACRGITPLPLEKKRRTVVTSGSRAVVLSDRPAIVGERINPTGKSKFKAALRAHDGDYILREAVAQTEAGADILDVNVGLPGIDEAAMMRDAVCAVQSVTDAPLQIDTTNLPAMEAAMRLYNGKPLVNSVSGKREVMDAVFPLVKKYGGAVVALTLDEDGIPDTADGRVAIARRIVDEAARYGIGPENIVVDALTMTISTGQHNARVTLEALSRVKRELHVCTTLGVSNISFGLPRRELVNSAFLSMALAAGLDAAIMNPGSEAMMRAFRAACALRGCDDNCAQYIAYAAQTGEETAVKKPQSDLTLSEAVEKGMKELTRQLTLRELESAQHLDIIQNVLMPALDRVGAGFEKGTMFLPQLMMCAEAAKVAFGILQDSMAKSGSAPEKKGKIVLATVKGDIHDIGKNIVKVLLENYAYEVIDLGKDVPPERVLQAVRDTGAPLVGLSALMTTTVGAMEETITLLHREAPGTRIVVGGAVLNPEYAQRIGADFYAKDAMATVACAQQVFAN